MKQSPKHYPESYRKRHDATAYLAVGGNRLLLSLATIVLLSVVMLYVMLYLAYAGLSTYLLSQGGLQYDHTAYLTAYFSFFVFIWLSLLVTLFLTIPLIHGFFFMASRIALGEETTLCDLFHSFSSAVCYWRAIRLSLRFFLILTVLIHGMILTYLWAIDLSPGNGWMIFLGALLILFEILVALIFAAMSFFRLFVAYANPNLPLDLVTKKAQFLSRTYKSAAYRYFVDYLPWILLSFATAGILFVADTLPRMGISYFLYCGEIEREFYQSEDIIDYE